MKINTADLSNFLAANKFEFIDTFELLEQVTEKTFNSRIQTLHNLVDFCRIEPELLEDNSYDAVVKLFAAATLKGGRIEFFTRRRVKKI